MFNPSNANQNMLFCDNAPNNNTSVCTSPTNTLNNSSSGGNLQVVNVPSPGTLFNVTIKVAPSLSYTNLKFGPGAGITCQQRSAGPEVGTANGITLTTTGLDWTGAGLLSGVQYYNFWFTRCSFDAGVTTADFYAIFD